MAILVEFYLTNLSFRAEVPSMQMTAMLSPIAISGQARHSTRSHLEKNIPLDLFLDSIRFHNGPCPDMEPRTLNNQESAKRNPDAKRRNCPRPDCSFSFSGQWDQLPRGQLSIFRCNSNWVSYYLHTPALHGPKYL